MCRFLKTGWCSLSLACTLGACTKWLDKKPDVALATVSSVAQAQALLDNHPTMNTFASVLGEQMADNYYCSDGKLLALGDPEERQLYQYAYDSVRFARYSNPWARTYDVVFVANTAIESLDKMPVEVQQTADWRNAYGSALFYRARSFFTALLVWSMPYETATAASLPGIPLRLNADFNETSRRASIADGYDRVEQDLQQAISLLPAQSGHPFRPSQCAAHGYLSRLYLAQGDYARAGQAAAAALAIYDRLLDFNSLNLNANFPFRRFNEEVIHQLRAAMPAILIAGAYSVDSVLLSSYGGDDLRLRGYYRSMPDASIVFKGSYEGNANLFVGLATDELYLTWAECLVRQGDVAGGMAKLNTYLATRFRKGSFSPLQAGSAAEALSMVLTERRKGLAFRDIRWMDLRRLNTAGGGIVVSRKVFGKEVSLQPGSRQYALPLPADVVERSGMEQNRY